MTRICNITNQRSDIIGLPEKQLISPKHGSCNEETDDKPTDLGCQKTKPFKSLHIIVSGFSTHIQDHTRMVPAE